MWLQRLKHQYPKLLWGDWLVLMLGIFFVIGLFGMLWTAQPASRLQVRQGNHVYGVYDLNQTRTLRIQGPLGETQVIIQQGKVRFKQSPCTNQYCVHQGWLKQAGQAAICLPNRISLELLGASKPYDSLNY